MKIASRTTALLLLGFTPLRLSAEEPATKCEMCEMMKKKTAAKADEQQAADVAAQNAELNKLVWR